MRGPPPVISRNYGGAYIEIYARRDLADHARIPTGCPYLAARGQNVVKDHDAVTWWRRAKRVNNDIIGDEFGDGRPRALV